MSTSPPPPSSVPMPTKSADEIELKIVSHSNLFYWWPVWAVGFLMALLTWIDGHHQVVVPNKSEIQVLGENVSSEKLEWKSDGVTRTPTTANNREAVVLPEKSTELSTSKNYPLKLLTADNPGYGVIFATTLLLVIVITNVPLRGMWSVVVIITVVLVSIIFAVAGWWEAIFRYVGQLDIRLNVGGYLFLSIALLVIWLVTFVFFDRQMYMIFTPGQLKVCMEIGGGEKAYSTGGMTFEKKRSDLFRHWILGLGSGDLIVNTAGANAVHLEMPNVLFIGKKVQMVEDMMREQAVVKGRA